MAGKARINVVFSANLKQFSSDMQNASRSIKKMGKQMQNVGKTLSVGITAPFAAFAAVSLKNWDQQEKAIAQLNAGLRSTGNAVGYTSDQLQKMASSLQNNTLFGDEEILKDVTSQLLTFTNIAGTQFERTQQAALDLATRLDGDLKSASIQLGKALNDPVANLSALSRSGIQFSEDQKAMINSLVETNRLADAQTIILDELEKQYGGSAEAAARAGLGPFKQLQNSIGDLGEEFGKIIGQALLPFVDRIKELVSGFQSLSPETKKYVVVIGSLAAAVGPVLLALGTFMTTVLPGLITMWGGLKAATIAATTAMKGFNLAAIANPIGVVVAALAALAYWFNSVVAEITPAVSAMQTFFNGLKSGGNYAKFVQLQMLSQAKATMDQQKAAEEAAKAQDEFNKKLQESAKASKALASSLAVTTAVTSSGVSTSIESTVAGLGASASTDQESGVSGALASGGIGDAMMDQANKLSQATTTMQTSMTGLQESSMVLSQSINSSFSRIASGISNSLQTGIEVLDAFVGTLFNSLSSISSAFIEQLLVEKVFAKGKKNVDLGKANSNAVVMATNTAAALGPFGSLALPGLIAKNLAMVSGAFAGFAGAFANGGVVPGASYTGDKLFAAVNSGEMILNQRQQSNLVGMLSGAGGANTIHLTGEFKMAGRDMKMVIDEYVERENRKS